MTGESQHLNGLSGWNNCQQFLWIKLLAMGRARLHLVDFAQLFSGAEKYGSIFGSARHSFPRRFRTIFVDKIVRKALGLCQSR
jgi:hypothetical protein